MNANLVHKFPITDEEYNHVEGSVLNVKQKVPSARTLVSPEAQGFRSTMIHSQLDCRGRSGRYAR